MDYETALTPSLRLLRAGPRPAWLVASGVVCLVLLASAMLLTNVAAARVLAATAVSALAALILLTPWTASAYPEKSAKNLSRETLPRRIAGMISTRAGVDRCEILDMSIAGLLISAARGEPFTTGEELKVSFALGRLPISVQTRVAGSEPHPTDPSARLYRAEFVSPSSSA